MAWTGISNTVPQYEENGIAASGFYIKFYASGTVTPIPMAIDSTGVTTLAKCLLSTEGYPLNGSSAVFIPHIDQLYKIILYRNATDADADTTANAVWIVDSLSPVLDNNSTFTGLTDFIFDASVLNDVITSTTLVAGQTYNIAEHTLGTGGGGLWDIVLASTVTINAIDIVQSTGTPALAIVLRIGDVAYLDQMGVDIASITDAAGTASDSTAIIQRAADLRGNIVYPRGRITQDSLVTLREFGQILKGSGQKYGECYVDSSISSALYVTTSAVNYLQIEALAFLGDPATSTDFYNTGSILFDMTAGTNINFNNSWARGFDTLFKSNYNSYYNIINNSRIEEFQIGLEDFNNNNLNITLTRAVRFNTLVKHNGSGGPFNIYNSTIEIFNGPISQAIGSEESVTNFKDNYIEVGGNTALPTNFPDPSTDGFFGRNILFTGPYGILTLSNNEMQIPGAVRIVSASGMSIFHAEDNWYHDYATGSFMDKLYSIPSCDSIYVHDSHGNDQGAGTGVATLIRSTLRIGKPRSAYHYYDAMLDSYLEPDSPTYSETLTLVNGWAAGWKNNGAPSAIVTDRGLVLSGILDGTAKTAVTIAVVSADYRPIVDPASVKTQSRLFAVSDYGGGNLVKLRYFYATGDLILDGSPASLANIVLDGITIPTAY